MKTTLLALGTRGDLQPAIALGKGLAARGHAVHVLASANFRAWVEAHGLEPTPASYDAQSVMASELGREWVARGTNPVAQGRIMKRLLAQYGAGIADDVLRACEGAELIVSSFTTDLYAAAIAEATGAAHVSAPLQPSMFATRSGHAALAAVVPRRDSVLNLLFGRLFVERTVWGWYGPSVNHLRVARLGLPAVTREAALAALRRTPVVHGYSAHVTPRARDWPAAWDVSGYWFLDEAGAYEPPAELARFLAAGPPPVCIGFGSMTTGEPGALARLLVDAVTRSGQRAIVLAGWAGLETTELPATMLRLDAAPHDWLYPRVSAVVTHGGAGTVGASLRAGRPTVVVPHMSDQLYWGRRVAELGVGPAPIARPRLTAARLADAITRATREAAIAQRAEALGRRIRDEDGVGRAAAWIEQRAGEHRRA